MGNQFRVEVRESSEELQHRLRYAITAATKERVQMLYWIKTQAMAFANAKGERNKTGTVAAIRTRSINSVSLVETVSARRDRCVA